MQFPVGLSLADKVYKTQGKTIGKVASISALFSYLQAIFKSICSTAGRSGMFTYELHCV